MKFFSSKKFHNLDPAKKHKGFVAALQWLLTRKKPHWPSHIPLRALDLPPPIVDSPTQVRVSFVGHVTFLIQTNGLNILKDPVWSERASPFSFIGPKRVTEPGIQLKDLPKIDVIIISHNHYDHMDLATIKRLWERDQPQIIVPLGNERILQKNIANIIVHTLNWGEKIAITPNTVIQLEAAQHWSARGLFDRNTALWGTFIIKAPVGDICFIGDSGYNQADYQNIGNQHNILLSLIPIGAFEPRSFLKDVHMNPDEAVRLHLDLKSQYSIASHFQTFPLADDTYEQAAIELETARQQHHLTSAQFITPTIGGSSWFAAKPRMPKNQ